MVLTALFIVLAVQRLLHWDSIVKHYDWFSFYYLWMRQRFAKIMPESGHGGVCLFVLPALVLFLLMVALVYHLLGIIGYYVVMVLVLWYCLDARLLSTSFQPMALSVTTQQWIVSAYRSIFAIIFWVLILGPVGMVFYTLILVLSTHLARQKPLSDQEEKMLRAVQQWQGVLDWIPLRLTGIGMALVSHFIPTTRVWYHSLWTGLRAPEDTLACSLTALDLVDRGNQVATLEEIQRIDHLISRTLWVWLVVIALFTMGMWFG